MTFILPCRVQIGRKEIPLNINWYRNAHYRVLADAKRSFAPVSIPARLEKLSRCRIDYTINLPTGRRTDAANWISVIDKFFADWLVAACVIADDDHTHYCGSSWSITHDKSQPMQVIAEVS